MSSSRPRYVHRCFSAVMVLGRLVPRLIVLGHLCAASWVVTPPAAAFTWPWEGSPWPKSSGEPVRPLDHPSIEDRVAALQPGVDAGYRFVVFGDQRALADGESQTMISVIDSIAAVDNRLLFALDTGDIVQDGSHSDQFEMLRRILSPLSELPYLVGVGNHEVDSNRSGAARAHTATFLSYLDPAFTADRMYYRKDVGTVRFLFLDTNDLVYGENGARSEAAEPPPGSRSANQLEWLVAELESSRGFSGPIIVVMHHPIVQSSKKHGEAARSLWNLTFRGRTFPDLLADGGVDVVLCGHTHTCEWFRLRRAAGGATLHVLNVSGRPRTTFLWMGDRARSAREIGGREREWLAARGWTNTEKWEISQAYAMTSDEADQFAVITVTGAGALELDLCFTDDDAPGGLRRESTVRLE